jgi:hypothetical protein
LRGIGSTVTLASDNVTRGDHVFLVGPDREPDRTPRRPREPAQTYMPLAQPPASPRSWWGSIPGQLALVAMLGGAIVIALGLMGVLGPLSAR